jgi:peptide-methionine (R)-S-oxide reductase
MAGHKTDDSGKTGSREPGEKVEKSEQEWREQLTPEQYQIARQAGTERAFSGEHWDSHEDGTYSCMCCGQELFRSDTKYDSGTGWPSFWAPVDDGAVARNEDASAGMVRIEVVCSRCDAHLGHQFPDGPAPTAQRYCMNSASLKFEKE